MSYDDGYRTSDPEPIVLCLKRIYPDIPEPKFFGARCQLRAGHAGECDPDPWPSLDGLTSVARQRVMNSLPPGITNELPHLPKKDRCPRCAGTGTEASAEDFRGAFVHFIHDANAVLRIQEGGGSLFMPTGVALRIKDEFAKASRYDKIVRLLSTVTGRLASWHALLEPLMDKHVTAEDIANAIDAVEEPEA